MNAKSSRPARAVARPGQRAALALIVAFALAGGQGAAQAQPVQIGNFPDDTLQIMVPANPGGGLDTTAREIQRILHDEGISARPLEVINVPGGGQTVGLARLLSQYDTDGHAVLVMGFGLVGGIHVNQTEVTLEDVTPIARLTTEYDAIAVSNDSTYQTVEELLADFQADPRSIVWGGGPGGSPDHLLVGAIADALGVDPGDINYVAFSGSEPRAQIMGNQVTAGVVGFGELKADGEAGLLRVLAVSGETRLEGSSSHIPTLVESGLDVVLTNWRGIVAGPNVSEEARDVWIEMLTRMHESQAWRDTLVDKDWTDDFALGEVFGDFMDEEDERTRVLVQSLGLSE